MATVMMKASESSVEQLRQNAARCRALAENASDPEAKAALAQLADDIDLALSAIEQDQQD